MTTQQRITRTAGEAPADGAGPHAARLDALRLQRADLVKEQALDRDRTERQVTELQARGQQLIQEYNQRARAREEARLRLEGQLALLLELSGALEQGALEQGMVDGGAVGQNDERRLFQRSNAPTLQRSNGVRDGR